MYQEFSKIYEEKIKEDFDYKKMAEFMRQQLQTAGIKPDHILDMGCGTGNAGVELATLARQMVLCDPSSDMLTLARNKFKAPYLPQFILGRADEVRLPDRFDLVLSVLDVPNYLDKAEFRAYLTNSFSNLKATGLLIFDISTVYKLEEMARIGTFIYDDENYFHVWENDLQDNKLELEINLFSKTASSTRDDLYQRITEKQTMFLHTTPEIEEQARAAGFRILGTYDGYTLLPGGSTTKRLVFVLKKEKK